MSNPEKDRSVIIDLTNKIEDSRKVLLGLLHDWHYLHNILHPRLMFIYDSHFSSLEYEIQQKNKIIFEMERRVQIFSANQKKGEVISETTIKYVNNLVNKEYERLEKKSLAKFHKNELNGNGNRPEDNKQNANEIPVIYRKLVKKLHPDVSGETESFRKFWFNIQAAYKDGDLQRLKLFYKTLCVDEKKKHINKYSEELALRNEIRKLQMNISAEQRKIKRVKMQPPFAYEEKLNDAYWVIQKKRKLKDNISDLNKSINKNKQMLRSLTGREWPSFKLMTKNL